jgi:hypothetical protein
MMRIAKKNPVAWLFVDEELSLAHWLVRMQAGLEFRLFVEV